MCKRKVIELKRCEVCGKLLRDYNKTGLCSFHYKMSYQKQSNPEEISS